jgi:hypothetical protein
VGDKAGIANGSCEGRVDIRRAKPSLLLLVMVEVKEMAVLER